LEKILKYFERFSAMLRIGIYGGIMIALAVGLYASSDGNGRNGELTGGAGIIRCFRARVVEAPWGKPL
jgi:hypothetical protein